MSELVSFVSSISGRGIAHTKVKPRTEAELYCSKAEKKASCPGGKRLKKNFVGCSIIAGL